MKLEELENRILYFEQKVAHISRILDNIEHITFDINLVTREEYFSPKLAKILELESDEQPTQSLLSLMTHSDDISFVTNKTFEILATKKYVPFEYRLISRSGKTIWIMNNAKFVSDIIGNEHIIGTLTDISERKLKEESILKTNQLLTVLFNNTLQEIYFLDSSYKLMYFNQISSDFFKKVYGLTLENGIDLRKILPVTMVHEFEQIFVRALAGETFIGEKNIEFSSEMNRRLVQRFVPIRSDENEVIGVMYSVHTNVSLKNSQMNLIETENRFSNLFDHSPIAMIEQDYSHVMDFLLQLQKNGISDFDTHFSNFPADLLKCISLIKIKSVNNAAVSLFEFKNKADLILHIHEVFSEKTLIDFKKFIISLINKQSFFETESEQLTKNKLLKYIYMRIFVPKPNDFTSVISAVVDINEMKLTQTNLITSSRKKQENEQLKTMFLKNIFNEIRTSLDALVEFTDILQTTTLPVEEQHHYFELIKTDSNKFSDIINDLIDISDFELGSIDVENKKFELNNMFELLFIHITRQNELVYKKTIDFTMEIPDNKHFIFSDYDKLLKIMKHVLGNALKFTLNGFIKFGYKTEANSIHFFVKDSGIGINKNKQNTIFEKYRLESEGQNRKFSGSGLGLAICKSYLNLLGGTISVQSEQGKGAIFTISLPLK